jgi:hypothetical protein
MNPQYRRKRRDTTKDVDNIFNKRTAESFPNIKRGPSKEASEHQTVKIRKETPLDMLWLEYSMYRTKKEY